MDKKIKKKRFTLKRIVTWTGIVALVTLVGYQLLFADRRSKLNVEKEKITISTVKRGVFQEYIPQTGIVQPSRTVFLDAVEGGIIKRVAAESGSMLKRGDVIVELSNLNREITVLDQEARLNESLNQLRQTRLQLTQNDLTQQQQLAEIDNQLAIFGPQYERMKKLYEKKMISKQEFERVEADFLFNKKRREITYQAYKTDSLGRIYQLNQINSQEKKMTESLNNVGKILDNLIIKSPIEGQLTSPQLEVGQSVNSGERLGQVDVVGSYKVRVPIDEYHLPRIATGLIATTKFNNQTYELKINYIYPNITDGRFEVDMEFIGKAPEGIRRGQSLRLRIELSKSSEELLLPVGGFYKDTGGNWVFVLDEGNRAVRRDVSIGRKNAEFYEVLGGLEPGDKVITSSYDNFGDNEVLILK